MMFNQMGESAPSRGDHHAGTLRPSLWWFAGDGGGSLVKRLKKVEREIHETTHKGFSVITIFHFNFI